MRSAQPDEADRRHDHEAQIRTSRCKGRWVAARYAGLARTRNADAHTVLRPGAGWPPISLMGPAVPKYLGYRFLADLLRRRGTARLIKSEKEVGMTPDFVCFGH